MKIRITFNPINGDKNANLNKLIKQSQRLRISCVNGTNILKDKQYFKKGSALKQKMKNEKRNKIRFAKK